MLHRSLIGGAAMVWVRTPALTALMAPATGSGPDSSSARIDPACSADAGSPFRKRRTGAKRLKGLEFDSPLRAARGLVVRPSG
jgi:hypothetical protein